LGICSAFITHGLSVVRRIADRACVMRHRQVHDLTNLTRTDLRSAAQTATPGTAVHPEGFVGEFVGRPMIAPKFDHVLLVCRNLYVTADQLRVEGGLDNYEGGYFHGLGLAQRIVPLGNRQFLEIESIIDPDAGARSPRSVIPYILEATRDQPTFLSTYVLTDDVEREAARLGLPLHHVTRMRPDGIAMSGILSPGVDHAKDTGLPIWFPPYSEDRHPADREVDHRFAPDGIAWVELGGEEAAIRRYLGTAANGLPIRYAGGGAGINAVAIAMADGSEVILRPSGDRLVARA
jgi:Glyoxalase-like domain